MFLEDSFLLTPLDLFTKGIVEGQVTKSASVAFINKVSFSVYYFYVYWRTAALWKLQRSM